MKQSSKAIDPLWQALCPSFNRNPFRGPALLLPIANVWSKSNTQQRNLTSSRAYQDYRLPQENTAHQSLNEVPKVSCDDHKEQSDSPSANGKLGSLDSTRFRSRNAGGGEQLNPDYLPSKSEEPQIRFWDPVKESDNEPHDGRNLQQLMHDGSYEELRRASAVGDYPRVREVLRMLVRMRGETPNRRMYQSLLLANTNPHHGSPAEVSRIIKEMAEQGIELDSAAYHAILKVLAIHPDYLLRKEMLEGLRQRWFTLSNEGWHDVIMGFLRDKQVETAIDTLQAVQRQGIRIQPWLFDTILYNLCDVEEFDEALSILQFRVDNGEQLISGELWYYFLDTASRALHYAAVLYAWRERVEMGHLNPPSGVCLNVLNVAARYSDSALATSVFRILGPRSQTLQLYHYEALLESYLPSDLKMAFTILTLMAASGQTPTGSTTRPLFLHLCQSASLPSTALSILRDSKKQNRSIPPEAVNVIIESLIHHNDLNAAVEVYKNLHTLSPKGATTATFNILFRGCRTRKDLAMFLAAEMVAMKLAPDSLTYDRLILVCLNAAEENDDMDDAWRYFDEMRKAGWWPRLGTSTALARKCCERGDDRIWKLVGEQEGTLSRQTIERLVKKDWQGEMSEKWKKMGMAQSEDG